MQRTIRTEAIFPDSLRLTAVADPLPAALAASLLYNRAGEAAEARAEGPGSFQMHLLDALWNTTPEQVAGSPIDRTSVR